MEKLFGAFKVNVKAIINTKYGPSNVDPTPKALCSVHGASLNISTSTPTMGL